MSLSNYKAPRENIDLKGGSFSVRGLSLQDVSMLVQHHLPDIEAVFDLFGHLDTATPDEMRPVVTAMVAQAPGFAANVIALASDEPEQAQTAATLPAPVQIDALMKIGNLTFSDVGGPKNAMETIVALLANAKPNLTKVGMMKAG